jgi:hypothetical protein
LRPQNHLAIQKQERFRDRAGVDGEKTVDEEIGAAVAQAGDETKLVLLPFAGGEDAYVGRQDQAQGN